jgi:N-sulfoglucosamine sulfohydrolase
MKRLLPILALALLVLPLQAAEKNIVFIIGDDLGPNFGCYGPSPIKTPAIDALARDGLLFRNAFATTASCSASRSVILSGLQNHANAQYGHQHSYHHFSAYPNVAALTLPRALAQVGYRTAQVGKYHVAPEEVFHFEQYFKANGRSPIEMAEAVADFIRDKKDERPFFLYFATNDPHRGGGEDETEPEHPNLFGNKPNKGAWPQINEVFYKPEDMVVPPFLPDTPACRAELAQYAQSVSRIDQGVARLVQILKDAGVYEKTLIVVTSDHGIAMPGAKTTVYEPGLRVPFIVRNPYAAKRGIESDAMISHVDITPSLLDFGGGLDAAAGAPIALVKNPPAKMKRGLDAEMENLGPVITHYQGRSWVPILEQEKPAGWDVIYASHTFHEIQMYYPMRVVRDRDYKIIWNIAWPLAFPFASDLWEAPTWQAQWKQGESAPYGVRTVGGYIHRPQFELYDMKNDPDERVNLAADPRFKATLDAYIVKLKEFQKRTDDPWIIKWEYE